MRWGCWTIDLLRIALRRHYDHTYYYTVDFAIVGRSADVGLFEIVGTGAEWGAGDHHYNFAHSVGAWGDKMIGITYVKRHIRKQ